MFDSVPSRLLEPGWFKTEGGGYVCSAEHGRRKNTRCACLGSCASSIPIHSEWNQYYAPGYDTDPQTSSTRWCPSSTPSGGGGGRTNYACRVVRCPTLRRLERRKYHFVDAERTARGTVLVRENGAVVPADDVHVYPLSKFEGWNLNEAPIPRAPSSVGHRLRRDPVYASPSLNAPVGKRLDYHSTIIVEDEPVDVAERVDDAQFGSAPVSPDSSMISRCPTLGARPAVDGVRPGELD